MNDAQQLLIPEKIKVGFQAREGTYTKKLAYVIYYDQKGVLRKEKSWEGWRDKNIAAEEFKNEPTKIQIASKKKKLEALESRLNAIISPELRAKMELEAIANELL